MPLKTFVKVGNISNLSDARYCAGMGVDLLGFNAVEGTENYISPKVYQEIRGWVSGPAIVAEIYGISSSESLGQIVENYAPDFFEMTLDEFEKFRSTLAKPAIVKLPKTITDIPEGKINVAYWITENEALSTDNVLFQSNAKSEILHAIEGRQIKGVVLSGTAEERPGFKDYTALSEILEALDEY